MFGIKRNLTDALFSDYIRMRDKWTCQNCFVVYEPPTQGLHCSHFFGRGWKSTRWDVENAFALCFSCHTKMGSDPVGHYEFALKKHGRKILDGLTVRAHTPQKVDEKLMRIYLKALIKELKSKEIIYGARSEK